MNALARLPESLLAIFESLEESPDAVFATDRRNRIVFWNRAAERLLGYDALQTIGVDCGRLLKGCDVFDNRYCSEDCPVMRLANRAEPVKGFRMRVHARDGRSVNAEVAILQLKAPPPDDWFLAHVLHELEGLEEGAFARPLHAVPPQAPDRREAADVRVKRLSAREVEVLGMLAAGRSTPEIAERLHIAPLTARNHIQNILEKLEVHSKSEAVAFAFQKRIL